MPGNGITNLQILAMEASLVKFPYNGENLFTFNEWVNRGYMVQKGEKAFITTKLWRKGEKTDKQTEEKTSYFYLTKSFLFTDEQVKKLTDEEKKNMEIRQKIIRERAEKKRKKRQKNKRVA